MKYMVALLAFTCVLLFATAVNTYRGTSADDEISDSSWNDSGTRVKKLESRHSLERPLSLLQFR